MSLFDRIYIVINVFIRYSFSSCATESLFFAYNYPYLLTLPKHFCTGSHGTINHIQSRKMCHRNYHSSNKDTLNNTKIKLPSLDEIFPNKAATKICQSESESSTVSSWKFKVLPRTHYYPVNSNGNHNYIYPHQQYAAPTRHFWPTCPPSHPRIEHLDVPHRENKATYYSERVSQQFMQVPIALSSLSYSPAIPQNTDLLLRHHRSLSMGLLPPSQIPAVMPSPMQTNFNYPESQLSFVSSDIDNEGFCPVQNHYVHPNLPHSPYYNKKNPPRMFINHANADFTEPKIRHLKRKSYSQNLMKERIKKRRQNIPRKVNEILIDWLREHLSYPYPTKEEKMELLNKTTLGVERLDRWFMNARKRKLKELKKRADKTRIVSLCRDREVDYLYTKC